MRIDCHTHTTASDGSLSPTELLEKASENGIDMLAITDHDTVSGIASLISGSGSEVAFGEHAIQLVSGVEISSCWQKTDIHIVGLDLNLDDEALLASLETQSHKRKHRAQAIAHKLEKLGVHDAFSMAEAKAANGNIGRPHFAQVLIEQNFVKDNKQAFKKYLGQGKSAYVSTDWPDVAEAVKWIKEAGGKAVLAHPARYSLTASKLRRLISYFAESGGDALEFNGPNGSRDKDNMLVALCQQHDLSVSLGSDFHNEHSPWQVLGKTLPLPNNCRGVWETFGS